MAFALQPSLQRQLGNASLLLLGGGFLLFQPCGRGAPLSGELQSVFEPLEEFDFAGHSLDLSVELKDWLS